MNIVHKGMLLRERYLVTSNTSSANENLLMKMKASKSILEFIKVDSCDKVALCNVKEKSQNAEIYFTISDGMWPAITPR